MLASVMSVVFYTVAGAAFLFLVVLPIVLIIVEIFSAAQNAPQIDPLEAQRLAGLRRVGQLVACPVQARNAPNSPFRTYRIGKVAAANVVDWYGEATFEFRGVHKFRWFQHVERQRNPSRETEPVGGIYYEVMENHQADRPTTNVEIGRTDGAASRK